ncbi:hypothetical protein [Achromobacter denitrificans]|uniref:hypothetical protein n=1 Tax=Achromobacter denitrificans TaxID=32002 RepID=UPI0015828FD0|nr:hypothetical protein [Achromobacter denitrificans]
MGVYVLASTISRFTHPTKFPPKNRASKKNGGPKGCRFFIAIGAAYGAMRERGRLRLDKLMP